MQKKLLALVISLAITTTAQSAQAASSITYDPAISQVTMSGALTGVGNGKLGKSIRGIIPAGWNAIYSDAYIAGLDIEWHSAPNWTDALKPFAEKNSLAIMVDGGKKTVIFHRSNGVLLTGLKTVSSLSPAFEDQYQLSAIYQKALPETNDLVIKAAMETKPKDAISFEQEFAGISDNAAKNKTAPVTPVTPVTPVKIESSKTLIPPAAVANKKEKTTVIDGVTVKEETFSVAEPAIEPISVSDVTTDSVSVKPNLFSAKLLSSYLPAPEVPFLQVTGYGDDRLKVENGQLAFKVTPVSLEDNLRKLASYTAHTVVVYKVSKNHRLPNEFWVYGDGVLSIIDQLVDPFVTPRPVRANWYENNIIEITYEGANK